MEVVFILSLGDSFQAFIQFLVVRTCLHQSICHPLTPTAHRSSSSVDII